MLLQPRAYKLAGLPDRHHRCESGRHNDIPLWQDSRRQYDRISESRVGRKMLLLHQSGNVKVGEVVRYTLTYTPANDRILPTPAQLYLKIKNTSAIPLRAAYLHGPYTLHVSAYPVTFNPHRKVENPERDGTPEFEPLLKAGGSWSTKLTVPADIRETGADLGKRGANLQSSASEEDQPGTVTWIIEIASQILFSTSASVGFEVLVGRDERSLDLGFAAVAGHGHGAPGQVKDFYESEPGQKGSRRQKRKSIQSAGVYSKAVRLQVEDTEALWDKPSMPEWEQRDDQGKVHKRTKRKKLHLVIITHGLHSNLGADMLFLKESIDATVKQAREERRKRKAEQASSQSQEGEPQKETGASKLEDVSTAPLSGGQEDLEGSEDEEETIVRGFSGNAVRTENGIQYLGKRLAKYVLKFTYPDQPFLPIKKNLTKRLTDTFHSSEQRRKAAEAKGAPSHQGSSIHHEHEYDPEHLPYKFTSISFIGHSLGGLVQTYAIAYIQKHSPDFFQQIKPINFITMASPLLGLSNENPLYVKFALDFGLVGRTGQDLGLTWRAPTVVRGGWNAVIGGLGGQHDDHKENENGDPGAKPLLRILPTGPAHQVLKLFRNRTVYSNVVNDGIVPLRTSCLLFLDWRGLGKVDKARRENGLIGTMAEWGWHELTGTNESERSIAKTSTIRGRGSVGESALDDSERDEEHVNAGRGASVPQPAEDATTEDNRRGSFHVDLVRETSNSVGSEIVQAPVNQDKSFLDGLLDYFRVGSTDNSKTHQTSKRAQRAFSRAQTLRSSSDNEVSDDAARGRSGTQSNPTMRPHMPHLHTGQSFKKKRPLATRGDSITSEDGGLEAPPKTSIFESAGDILHPPMPSKEWITDPSTRARAIFHDRVYHPEDIPPPPVKRPSLLKSRSSFNVETTAKNAKPSSQTSEGSQGSLQPAPTVESASQSEGVMKVEEKIARAYHKDLSWRKVLVRIEPDAHNNMVVRRMFANAYGWPVVKHVCDTHFANTHAAMTSDDEESNAERAKPMDEPVGENGEKVKGQSDGRGTGLSSHARTRSEAREAADGLPGLNVVQQGLGSIGSGSKLSLSAGSSSTLSAPRPISRGSTIFDDSIFDSEAGDSDVDERGFMQRILNPMPKDPESPPSEVQMPERAFHRAGSSSGRHGRRSVGSVDSTFEVHRGLAPRSPASPKKSPPSRIPSMGGREEPASPIAANKIVQEPEPLASPSTSLQREISGGSATAAGVKGLGKSVAEQLSPTQSKQNPSDFDVGGQGVSETVARLSGK
ncbi:DUF676-domain-containing protein [Polychaeton citri CBS 116435]|uniref:DUF676-domain-containing protein n=1 Tax=Polychaeton citri CBS 116435 TaxID=1314669 RepID=A0A9P4QGQ3_9PEZI|nr:DUF676-domain-containing protein [Polychaeton citri CBS 116435]